MRQIFQLISQWVRPFLAGYSPRLILTALKTAYDLMLEIERQRNEGDGKFTNAEKAEWVKEQLKAQTSLPDSVIDFVFGIAIARLVREKREKNAAKPAGAPAK